MERRKWKKIKSNQERSRDWILKQRGSSLEEFLVQLQKQNKICLICMRQMRLTGHRGAPYKAVLDHDHVTGKKRGIICHRCNLAIGLLEDNVDILISAVVYLQSWNEEFAAQRR